jgi:sulfur-oxidizing protein SoxX
VDADRFDIAVALTEAFGYKSTVSRPVRPIRFAAALIVLLAVSSSHAQHHAPQHGTPQGWKFGLPEGDPAKGRQAFAKFECYKCHEVKGENFPTAADKENLGPELSMMGPMHDAEYFAESIVNPSKVIEKGKGYAAKDGSSRMPSFNDSMTVQELVDLVAYLKSLKPPGGAPMRMGH